MKILILGATGMLGSTIFRMFSDKTDWNVFGTVRSEESIQTFSKTISDKLISHCDVTDNDRLSQVITQANPDVVINCIGVVKQVSDAHDPVKMVTINSLLPHQLSKISANIGARLIHISTDCVFLGNKGNYTEDDIPDAQDIYGRSKLLGEVSSEHCITLRTSIIGPELNTKNGLLEWFLSQNDKCEGYAKAIFSGLPTIILAKIIAETIIPMRELHGVYHVASQPISKFNLLKLISDIYGKKIELISNNDLVIDRSLSADKFQKITGYKAPEWTEMIETMYLNQ